MSYQKRPGAICFPRNKNIEISSPKVHTIFLVFSLFDKAKRNFSTRNYL
nr:MAG TPA: hypothetical protein [Caudoviricetes sp.]